MNTRHTPFLLASSELATGLDARRGYQALEQLGQAWQPFRSYALSAAGQRLNPVPDTHPQP